MAQVRTGRLCPSFLEATNVEKLDSSTYRVNLDKAFCVGTVPNGGYAASCMLAAASLHLSLRGHPDTLTAHFEFPGRSEAGPAVVVIEEVKLGVQLSTLHLTLWQGGLLAEAPWITPSVSRRAVLAYTNHTSLETFTGMTVPTSYEVSAAAELPPLPDFKALKSQGDSVDDIWEESSPPESAIAIQRSLSNWHFLVPCGDPVLPGMVDIWMSRSNGERITQSSLPYVMDSFPFNLHTFLMNPELRKLMEAEASQSHDSGGHSKTTNEDRGRASLWFPTVALNLEIKKVLPEEGAEWLAMRLTSKQMKDGRFDLDIQVRDIDGELVALSHQVALIVEIERNTRKSHGSEPKAAL
ncbi:hypothetical protein N0V93_002953 [Gnomoniopsis smithogilvyi]|uniref:Thioesterase family protein n=1 Tax=Gnomoniopsis smithogilvyi TaxID=1191159 RepID=A0A9W8YYG1_9PEZI|nr:hypothetical protein N0V93_002953 [Gnomoniopsis smithogilvyi]